MIGLINYGMGNLHSVAKALEKNGASVELVTDAEALKNYDRIVLPGVGAFRDCVAALQENGMDEALRESVSSGTPFLGICLGMQVLMDVSHEFGRYPGLGLIPGAVKHFPEDHPQRGFKIPHMGWNDVVLSSQKEMHPVLAPLAGSQVYYVHSYCCMPEDPEHLLAACSYGDYPFAAAIGRDNIVAVQFHPEKSQRAGLALMEAFQQWNP
ncbi:glutamine amidotransferase [Mariprofundus micogutta]|uniref:Imidazole glycerol phosphate synthase subunit HisH n=1 Tax=Mariprofundus micogutta TaxID=1921010 RepID=A0A1L8CQ87_9PROT|nr:imidazole glycerol phosphate synthase subunit HisH [Mariprofundus micogutta]GAV21081.1 glutamine amidotransferase [Mariprofundus micogutta]